MDLYNFENSFHDEISKINNLNVPTMWGNKWGTDEAYSCRILSNVKPRNRVVDLSKSKDFYKCL